MKQNDERNIFLHQNRSINTSRIPDRPLVSRGSLRALVLALAAVLSLLGPPLAGETIPDDRETITDFVRFWELHGQGDEREYRIDMTFEVLYYDPSWRIMWVLEEEQGGTYVEAPAEPLAIESGDVIEITGYAVPGRQEILWHRSEVAVVADAARTPVVPLGTSARELRDQNVSRVETEGLVMQQEEVDATHQRLSMAVAVGQRMVTVYLQVDPRAPVPQYQGAFVRLEGVLVVEAGPAGQIDNLEIWVADPQRIEVRSWLAEDPRFDLPATPIENLAGLSSEERVRIEGRVHRREDDETLVLRDDSGQAKVVTVQAAVTEVGSRVEAIGYPGVDGVDLVLRRALVRPLVDPAEPRPAERGLPLLRLTELVRELGPSEAERGYPVRISGVVGWVDPDGRFLFLIDGSGGIRVVLPHDSSSEVPEAGEGIVLQGMSQQGGYVPAVTATEWSAGHAASFPSPRAVNLEQLLTGAEYGHWVETRAVLRTVRTSGELARLELTAAGGDFEAWMPRSAAPVGQEGAIVRIRGVCDVVANERGHLVGVRLWTAHEDFVEVLEAVPEDPFALPGRTIGSLLEFGSVGDLHRRVRLSGVVTLHRPGEFFYLQDEEDAVIVLSRSAEPLTPGERVEVVGFPGREGNRLLVREAVYRRAGTAEGPDPVPLTSVHADGWELDGRLVRTEAVLVDAVERPGEIRLLLQLGNEVFEARWVAESTAERRWEPGAVLGVTGVYRLERDEHGRARGFVVHLRDARDVEVLESAPWWTATRALWLALGLLATVVTTGVWGLAVSRKNHLLHQARGELQRLNDELESRVESRTQELQKEIDERKKAEVELAKLNQELLEASRLGGMAEIATSVLHNVGNVLNTVNVSADLVSSNVRNSRVSRLAKVVDLLREHDGDLGRFLTEDSRGRRVPAYLADLSGHLQQEREALEKEVASLRSNVEHIKEIVAMQQSYANVSGTSESLVMEEVIEDSLRMEGGSLVRHGVNIVRELDPVPPIVGERHKIVQILVNLVRNAKRACDDSGKDEKRITLRMCADGDKVRVSVGDNGVGIPRENLTRIFSHGFSTRRGGHGFGLHSSALFAQEMGGSLSVRSDGTGTGALFTLELPRQPNGGEK